MKKIITLFLSLLLIVAMAVPAYAVTPPLNTPSVTVPDISDSVRANIEEQYDFDHAVDTWLDENPITIDPTEAPTEEPTEPPAENEPACTDWHGWLSEWFRWWREMIH